MASVIVAGARTPFGKFGGAFKDIPATNLGAHAIRAALDRAGVRGAEVDYVIMGQVLQAGAGQITARQAAIEAGIPQEVPAITINKVCLSGLNAIALADQLIRAGEVEVVVAGGMESMSQAPYVVPQARFGARMGDTQMIDSMVHDGLWSTLPGSTWERAPTRSIASSRSAATSKTRGLPARTSALSGRGPAVRWRTR
jgi:acetyl-CoA C-acetyltransferase